jgi:chromosomal replication initiator protein
MDPVTAPVLYAKARAATTMAAPARVRAVVERVAADRKVPLADLLGRSRRTAATEARQAAYAAVREATGASYPMIGRWFGRDHSTVLTGARAHYERLEAIR